MRSYLYVPAANEKLVKKSLSLSPDVLIFDLEDSAAPAEKAKARDRLQAHLQNDFKAKRIMVRVNSNASREYEADLMLVAEASAQGKVDGTVLPKVDSFAEINALDIAMTSMKAADDLELWAMIETPLGVLHADQLAAASARLRGFILGLEDLSTKLGGIQVNADRSNISYAMQRVVMAARAYDMLAIDAVCTDYKNADALKTDAEQAKDLGYDGKSLIHPDQIEPTNAIFGVSEVELERAHKIIDAFEAAMEKGESVATLDGHLVEALHFEAAKDTALAYRAQKS